MSANHFEIPDLDLDMNLLERWQDGVPRTWQQAAEILGQDLFPADIVWAVQRLEACAEFLKGFPGEEWNRVGEAILDLHMAAAGFVARLGFGLARTWPESVEDLQTWVRRAWEEGDLDSWVAMQRDRRRWQEREAETRHERPERG